LKVDHDGSEKFRIASSGNVGIGTTSPSSLLHVSSGNLQMKFPQTDGGDVGLQLETASSIGHAPSLHLKNPAGYYRVAIHSSDASFRLYNGQDRFYVSSTGVVGIDTNTPSSGKLHVNGTISGFGLRVNDNVYVGSGTVTSGRQDAAYPITAQKDGDAFIRVASGDNGGNTGVQFQGAGDRGSIYGTSGYNIHLEPNAQYGQADIIMAPKNGSTMNVGIGTTTPGYKLEVNGSFAATTKSFVIDHPTKEGMKLRHGSLEGPENGVYVRGRLTNSNTIELPEYWLGLVDEDSITVQLTAIGKQQNPWVKNIVNNTIVIEADAEIDCFYMINAERKDVEKFAVEYKE
jgi:hypothetical protein